MGSSRSFSFCLCADDFALSPGVSRGILAALQAERLTATSVMTTRPSWPLAARDLSAFQATAEIGLHLNLTLGAPLTPMPLLAPSGDLPSLRSLMSAATRGPLPEREIRTEIGAQIDAFTQHLGRTPDFIDGHQHVHMLPALRVWLFEALQSRGLQGQLWLRDSGDQLLSIARRGSEIKKALILAWLARGFATAAAERGFQTNQGFAGFSDFDAERSYPQAFERYLVAPGRRHLVMCHPGFVDDELIALDPVTRSRPLELEFLMSSRFTDCLAQRGAKLTRLNATMDASSGL